MISLEKSTLFLDAVNIMLLFPFYSAMLIDSPFSNDEVSYICVLSF